MVALQPVLAALNPWWSTGAVPAALLGQPRAIAERLLEDLEEPFAVVLTGVRRSGKTTILFQMIDRLLGHGVPPHHVLYVNLEELALEGVALDEIRRQYLEQFAPTGPTYLFVDEVQRRPDWTRWVRSIVDQKRDHIAVTGSTSGLLAGEHGAVLTGRHLTTTVRPLGFGEYLGFHGIHRPRDPVAPEDAASFVHHLDQYLLTGGFPQANVSDPTRARRILQHYFTDIMQRDLVAQHGLDPQGVQRLGLYLAQTFARPHTKRALQRATGNSRDTINTYLDAFTSAFILQPCHRYHASPKPEVRDQSPTKYYLVDPGMRNALAAPGSDLGRLAENAVANAIHAAGFDLRYWKDDRHEVDFVIARPNGRVDAIQVTYGDTVPEREVAALTALAETLPASRRGRFTLLARRDADTGNVPQVALWRWLCDQRTDATP